MHRLGLTARALGFWLLLVMLTLAGCGTSTVKKRRGSTGYTLDTLTLLDTARGRPIPVAIYLPKQAAAKVVVFSHGYGQNKGGDYLAYSYLTTFLAGHGYGVVSIQHELPTDSLLPVTGNLQALRRPFWERGADNILFVIRHLKRSHPALDHSHLALMGHSNGGDMTALFPQRHPGWASLIITLDNRRMPLPRTSSPRVLSLRSSDQPADPGVLPDEEERAQLGMRILTLHNTLHNDMDDSGTAVQHDAICAHVLKFLEEAWGRPE